MSGKYDKKKTPAGKKSSLWLIPVLVVVAVIVLALLARSGDDAADPVSEPSASASAASTEGQCLTAAETSFQLEKGLQITQYGAYAGIYMEDGTDEIVSDVLYILVTNTSEAPLQYAEITLSGPAGDASFSLSTLLPGEKMVVLESGRMPCPEEGFTQAQTANVVFFDEPLSLCQEQLKLQVLETAINVSNISGEDITGDIVIYYKNYAGGLYYGGITYRARIEGGLQADALQQIMPTHFDANSQILFVTIV